MKADPVEIHYRRGPLLYTAWFTLGVAVLFALAFIVSTARFVGQDPGLYLGLWALLIVVAVAVGLVMAPIIERLSRSDPAIVVSAEGIRTRDMSTLLPWDGIEKLTAGSATSSGGKYTTTVHVLEICPKEPLPTSSGWRQVVDGHAHPLKIAWHLLDRPARLRDALNVHAPPALLSKSDLDGLPTSLHTDEFADAPVGRVKSQPSSRY